MKSKIMQCEACGWEFEVIENELPSGHTKIENTKPSKPSKTFKGRKKVVALTCAPKSR